MINFYSIEAQIKNDWNVVRAFVALHPYWTIFGAGLVGALIGHAL